MRTSPPDEHRLRHRHRRPVRAGPRLVYLQRRPHEHVQPQRQHPQDAGEVPGATGPPRTSSTARPGRRCSTSSPREISPELLPTARTARSTQATESVDRPLRAARFLPVPLPALRRAAGEDPLPGRARRVSTGRTRRRSCAAGCRCSCSGSSPTSSSARACRTGRRSARSACRRAATGGCRATPRRRCGWRIWTCTSRKRKRRVIQADRRLPRLVVGVIDRHRRDRQEPFLASLVQDFEADRSAQVDGRRRLGKTSASCCWMRSAKWMARGSCGIGPRMLP